MKRFPPIKNKKDFDDHFQNEIWKEVAGEICHRHKIPFAELKRLNGSDHIVFLIDKALIIKIYRPGRNCFEREKKAIEFIGGKTDFNIPQIIQTGEIEGFQYLIMTRLRGNLMTRKDWLLLSEKDQISFIQHLAAGLKQIHQLDPDLFVSDWAEFVEERAETFIKRQITHGVNEKVIKALPGFIADNLKLIPRNSPPVFMHSDVHLGNLLIQTTDGKWQISGLFDFADSRFGFYEYDFLAIGLLVMQGQGKIQREFFKTYGYAGHELDESFRKRLMMLTMLYETADLRRYAMRLKPEAVDFTLEELEKGIWSFLD